MFDFLKKKTQEALEKKLQDLDKKKQAIEEKRKAISKELQERFQKGH